MSTFFSMEVLLQIMFLRELNDHDLFDGEHPRHVHVHPVGKNADGQEQYVLGLFVGGTLCQAGGFYAGDARSGTLRLDWAVTPCAPEPREYGTSTVFDYRKGRPVEHLAIALAT